MRKISIMHIDASHYQHMLKTSTNEQLRARVNQQCISCEYTACFSCATVWTLWLLPL